MYRHDPPLRARSTYVIEPLLGVAEPHHAPGSGRRDVSAAEPALPHHRGEPWCGPRVSRELRTETTNNGAEPSRTASDARARRSPSTPASLTTTTARSIDTAPLLQRCRSGAPGDGHLVTFGAVSRHALRQTEPVLADLVWDFACRLRCGACTSETSHPAAYLRCIPPQARGSYQCGLCNDADDIISEPPRRAPLYAQPVMVRLAACAS